MVDIPEKWKIFAKFYTDQDSETTLGNARQSAIAAGYSEKSAHKRGSELLKEPEVQRLIKSTSDIIESSLKTGERSLKDILGDVNLARQLARLESDPAKFIAASLKMKKEIEAMEEEFSGLSIAELIQRGNQIIKETQENISRVESAIREGQM